MRAIALLARGAGSRAHFHGLLEPRLHQPGNRNSAFRAMRELREPIQLTDLERSIFDTILSTKRERNLSVVLRCAGGWVRDKLLGLESLDIDIALDNMMGREFAGKSIVHYHGDRSVCISIDIYEHIATCKCRVQHWWLDCLTVCPSCQRSNGFRACASKACRDADAFVALFITPAVGP